MAADKSQVIIYNMAIGNLGVSATISNLTERSAENNACNRFYELCLESMLRELKPKWADAIAELTLVDEEPDDEHGYSYRYPADCVSFNRIQSGMRNENISQRIYYKQTSDDDGKLILTDMEDAIGEYTKWIEDVNLMPADFMIALSYRLSLHIGAAITGGDPFKMIEKCKALYDIAVKECVANEANEMQREVDPDGLLISSRS